MSEQIQRYDMDGNKISLRNLCIQEPDWAVNRILHLELSHPTNDAKAMIAEGLENIKDVGEFHYRIKNKLNTTSIEVSAFIEALKLVCKSNEQESK